MTDDIVARLREIEMYPDPVLRKRIKEAADYIEQLRSAIAERDMFIEIIGMCNEFEEFLSK